MSRTSTPSCRFAMFPRRFRPHRPRRRPRGFSLVEVLVALVLLLVGLGGVMGLYTRELKNLGQTQRRARADYLARGYLSQVQAMGYETLKSRHLKESPESFLGPNLNKYPEDPDFWWNARLKSEGASETKNLPPRVKIAVRVGWGRPPAEDSPKMDDGARQSLKIREVTGYAVAP